VIPPTAFPIEFFGGPLDGIKYVTRGGAIEGKPPEVLPGPDRALATWLVRIQMLIEPWQIYKCAFRKSNGVFIYRYAPEVPREARTA
jgi:hypothetical protein